MSSANVLPSAPPEEPLYPQLPSQPENFRLQRINEIANTLDKEVNHYRLVAKNTNGQNNRELECCRL